MSAMKPDEQLTSACRAIDEAAGSTPEGLLIAAKCRGLMTGFCARWRNAGYEPIAVESVLHKNLINPETQRQSRTFTLAGKLDVIARYSGRVIIIDGKTTSEDITDPNGPYWRQLVIEGQVSQYMLLAWMDGLKADGALWDVVHKPDIRPKKIDKAQRTLIVSNGLYFDEHISDFDRKELAAGREHESNEMYSFRLAHDCTAERPERYFQRRMVPRLDAEILEYVGEVWEHAQEMIATRQRAKETGKLPPRNSGACMLYGSPCKFLGICSGQDEPTSDRWRQKDQIHKELNGAVGEGRDVLTNSRIRCYQTCRRKHHFDYEVGIERIDEEDREALFFGTVWHKGLEAFWKFLLPKENDDEHRSDSSAVNAIAERTDSQFARLAGDNFDQG